jgi:hypothetical protein
MPLPYIKSEKVILKKYYDEKWLQNRIEEDPGLLGLGDLVILTRERRQSTGGRIDFLLSDPETDTRYEVEIQLGATDESHIIRTIEYWDIERRKNPYKDHIAVIVAEDITSRFFNVIALLNKSVPIIAIQLNVIKIEEKISLCFTKVLDTSEELGDEDLAAEIADRPYWESRSNPKSILLMDELINITKAVCPDQKVTYNKNHVALGTPIRNFAWFHPRKTEGYCQFNIKIGNERLNEVKDFLSKSGVQFSPRKDEQISLSLLTKVFQQNKDVIVKLFQETCDTYK